MSATFAQVDVYPLCGLLVSMVINPECCQYIRFGMRRQQITSNILEGHIVSIRNPDFNQVGYLPVAGVSLAFMDHQFGLIFLAAEWIEAADIVADRFTGKPILQFTNFEFEDREYRVQVRPGNRILWIEEAARLAGSKHWTNVEPTLANKSMKLSFRRALKAAAEQLGFKE